MKYVLGTFVLLAAMTAFVLAEYALLGLALSFVSSNWPKVGGFAAAFTVCAFVAHLLVSWFIALKL